MLEMQHAAINVPNPHYLSPICARCGYEAPDIRVLGCECTFHTRCIPISTDQTPLAKCPECTKPCHGLALFPMSFKEIDVAKNEAASTNFKRKKRKDAIQNNGEGGNKVNFSESSESNCRTGRWTVEEMALCDKLIETFKLGDFPIVDGIKLNDFLANMLKSKQSRLTKKMKNANLSAKTFKRTNGHILDFHLCTEFSRLEDAFFKSLSEPVERAEVKFHMQKEWREMFSAFCVSISQPLDVDDWLNSVEEMEKRQSVAKDAARLARRKMMMGVALTQDTSSKEAGVFIDRSHDPESAIHTLSFHPDAVDKDDFNSSSADKSLSMIRKSLKGKFSNMDDSKLRWHYASPFLGKIISFIQKRGYPFEQVDAWVPSFVSESDQNFSNNNDSSVTCRLCYAGSATAEVQVSNDGSGSFQLLNRDEQFLLHSFAEYSSRFSFNSGCGLPGRVYESGIPAWEQNVANAPAQFFERCGGAQHFKIKTVVGIPIPSPSVGRIVVCLYSTHDRSKDQEMVAKFYEEFSKLEPCPKWKLVVDIGAKEDTPQSNPVNTHNPSDYNAITSRNTSSMPKNNMQVDDGLNGNESNPVNDLVKLLGEFMPHDAASPIASYLPGFMSLRLLLLKPTLSREEEEITETLLSSYTSYLMSGRRPNDIAVMMARDYIFLKQQKDSENAYFNNNNNNSNNNNNNNNNNNVHGIQYSLGARNGNNHNFLPMTQPTQNVPQHFYNSLTGSQKQQQQQQEGTRVRQSEGTASQSIFQNSGNQKGPK